MKYFLIMDHRGKPTVMKVIDDDRLGRGTLPRARSVALAISGTYGNEPVQIAEVRQVVSAGIKE